MDLEGGTILQAFKYAATLLLGAFLGICLWGAVTPAARAVENVPSDLMVEKGQTWQGTKTVIFKFRIKNKYSQNYRITNGAIAANGAGALFFVEHRGPMVN